MLPNQVLVTSFLIVPAEPPLFLRVIVRFHVMVLKTLCNSYYVGKKMPTSIYAGKSRYIITRKVEGFTLIELVIATSLILLFLSGTILIVHPVEQLKKGRDNRRIGDISLIDRAITEYKVDYGSYPDIADTLRISTALPQGNSSLTSPTSGWIKQDLSAYTTKLPIDPLNNETYFYKYIQAGSTYELNANLEYYFEQAAADGGDGATVYEIGNNLTLIVN